MTIGLVSVLANKARYEAQVRAPVEAIACYADFRLVYQYPEGDPTLPTSISLDVILV